MKINKKTPYGQYYEEYLYHNVYLNLSKKRSLGIANEMEAAKADVIADLETKVLIETERATAAEENAKAIEATLKQWELRGTLWEAQSSESEAAQQALLAQLASTQSEANATSLTLPLMETTSSNPFSSAV